jgi:hypothetical protein
MRKLKEFLLIIFFIVVYGGATIFIGYLGLKGLTSDSGIIDKLFSIVFIIVPFLIIFSLLREYIPIISKYFDNLTLVLVFVVVLIFIIFFMFFGIAILLIPFAGGDSSINLIFITIHSWVVKGLILGMEVYIVIYLIYYLINVIKRKYRGK